MIEFIATPIGNLKDITLRALEELKEADAVFCEDTRHTLKLLTAYEIKKPLYACHKFNEREAAEHILSLSREGKKVAIVSDAGMPVISDPGSTLCRIFREAGEPYTVIPGPCAFVCALVLSAFPADRFCFIGFLSEKKKEREEILRRVKSYRETLIFHVAPQDIDAEIADLYAVFGDRKACLVREITKIHEESVTFLLSEGYQGERRGECILLVEGEKSEENPLNSLTPEEHVKHYIEMGYEKKEAVKLAARDRGVPKNEIYKLTVDLR